MQLTATFASWLPSARFPPVSESALRASLRTVQTIRGGLGTTAMLGLAPWLSRPLYEPSAV